jgi:AmmeMemoRadiSam system protein B/AmmeMemoRadiSam system protein A
MGSASGRSGGVREPAVAGQFYQGRPDRLAAEVDQYVAQAREALAGTSLLGAAQRQVAIVVPHAGHVYSGPTAGYAFAAIDPAPVRHVVLLGPAHYVPIDGIGVSTASAWRTPLGDVPLDAELAADLREHFDSVEPGDAAHTPEHSLEVQVPFLQRVLGEGWSLVPLIVGADLPEELGRVIARCVAHPGTLVVVSTDLSHYLDHDSAVIRDRRTIQAIVERRASGVGPYDACGRYPLRGLLVAAEANDWTVSLLDARNSGDTAGGWDRVVGYAAFLVTSAGAQARVRAGRGAVGAPVDVPGGAAGPGSSSPGQDAAGSDNDPSGSDTGVRIRDEITSPGSTVGRITPESRAALLHLARRTIEDALATGRRPRFDPTGWNGPLAEPGAAFVTLRSADGDLLGCIGSLSAHQPLAADVAEHAYDAAFRDPRFLPMTPERAEGMVIDISVLSPTTAFPAAGYQDLLARLPVGSGVVVQDGRHRATFLPAVWEQLPEPDAFLAALWRKAGLPPGHWSPDTQIEVYHSEEFAEV